MTHILGDPEVPHVKWVPGVGAVECFCPISEEHDEVAEEPEADAFEDHTDRLQDLLIGPGARG